MSFSRFIRKIERKENKFNFKDSFRLVKYINNVEQLGEMSFIPLTSKFTAKYSNSRILELSCIRQGHCNYIDDRWALVNKQGDIFFAKDIPEEYIER